MANKVRFGVIGVGNMGAAHSRWLKQGKGRGATLGAICDIDPAKKALADELGVPFFQNYIELYDSGLVDAVLIATPHYWHAPQTVAAAKRGLHVICEKPVSVTVGHARTMVQACQDAGVHFAVMFMQRLRPAMQKMKQIIDSGQLGEISRISMVASNWLRTQSYYNSGGWRGTWIGEGGGILMNQAPHSLDLFLWMAGQMPNSVTASIQTREHKIEVENTANAIIDFGGGKIGYIYATTAEAPGTEEMMVVGTKGTLLYRGGTLSMAKLATPLDKHLQTAKGGFEKPKVTWKDVKVTGKDLGHMGIVTNFVKVMHQGAAPVASGQDGINEIELCDAIYMAGFTGKPVELPLSDLAVERMITGLIKDKGRKGAEDLRNPATAELKRVLGEKGKTAKAAKRSKTAKKAKAAPKAAKKTKAAKKAKAPKTTRKAAKR